MSTDGGRSQSARVERACKPCRDLKVRCVPPRGGEVVCQKCQRSGACCIFEERRPRKKRKVDDKRLTIENLEAKLADLAKKLEVNNSQQQYTPDSALDTQQCSHTLSPDDQPDYTTLRPSSLPYSITETVSSAPSHGECFVQPLFRDGILTASNAHSYLSTYREMCIYFPFVIIPAQATVQSLLQSHPILLHALLAVASSNNKVLQSMLDKSLRQRLLEAVLIDGTKSIELLQAILVHLAWEHFFYIPRKRHSDQMLQIAISMCIDVGLIESPKEASARKIGVNLEHHYSAGGTEDDAYFSKAARRAYIGCYYLSTVSSWVWRKPTNFSCTEYLMECAQSLSEDPEFDSDKHILKLLQTQVLGDKYHDTLLSSDSDVSHPSGSDQVQAHLQCCEADMDDILSDESSDNLLIRLFGHFATSYAHEMDQLTPVLWRKRKPPSDTTSHKPPTSKAQTDIFMVCLNHAKAFVESFLSISLAEYTKLSAVQWWGLICNVTYLYTLTAGTLQLPGWNACDARKSITLEIYLDLLCYRMQSITDSMGERSESRDLFSVLGNIFANVKTSYEKLKKSAPPPQPDNIDCVHGTKVFEERIESQSIHARRKIGCPAFSLRSNNPGIDIPPSHGDQLGPAYSDLCMPLQPRNMISLDDFQLEASWPESMPDFGDDAEINTWDFGMM